MPLKRFFYSARRAKRSESSNGRGRNTDVPNNEISIASLDDIKLKETAYSNDSDRNTYQRCSSMKKADHPTHPIQWNSANCLIPNPNSVAKKISKDRLLPGESAILITPSPMRRLRFTISSDAPPPPPSLTTTMASESHRELVRVPTFPRQHSNVRKKLSNIDDLSRLELSADGYRLTNQQRDLLKLCWKQANCRQGEPGRFIFNWVFTKYPDIKSLFGLDQWNETRIEPRFQKHIQAFTDLLELVVTSVLDEKEDGLGAPSLDDTTGPLLHSYGAKHVQVENRLCSDGGQADLIRSEYWDIFRTAMCEYGSSAWRTNVFSTLSGSAQKRNEALHAWSILIYYLIAKVKQGYEIEKNEQKKRGRGRSVAE